MNIFFRKPRLRSPPALEHPTELERREMGDVRKRDFERMYRDAPGDGQGLNWSDARVRFNYYKYVSNCGIL